MKRKITEVLSAAFAVLFLTTAAGCGNTAGNPDGTTVSTAAVTTEPVSTEETLGLKPQTYDGREFRILLSGFHIGKLDDFGESDGASGYDTVCHAIYVRDQKIEEQYGVKLSVTENFGNQTGGVGPGFTAVAQDYLTGDCTYDMCEVSTYDAAKLAMNGYLYDLASMPNIELEKSWWDQKTISDLSIQNRLFYVTGDISASARLATHCMLFNKDVASEKSITDLYELVENGTWTLDRFLSYVKLVSDDVDGNGVRDAKDSYGLITWNDAIQGVFAGGCSRIAAVNRDGNIELTLYSEKNDSLLSKFCEVAFDKNYTYNYTVRNNISEYDKVRFAMFDEDRALFYATCMNTVPKHRDSETEFGILPFPKYDETQESYGTYVAATYSVMNCVEVLCPDPEFTGYMMEAIAYESQKTVTPAYYEQTLIGRYVRDDESVECLDIIFHTRSFDVGVYYRIGDFTGKLTNMMINSNNNFVTFYEAGKTAAQVTVDEINAKFASWIQ